MWGGISKCKNVSDASEGSYIPFVEPIIPEYQRDLLVDEDYEQLNRLYQLGSFAWTITR